jgi:predicted O-linked N-acetylglucosamine transferase (SPINDLY family)
VITRSQQRQSAWESHHGGDLTRAECLYRQLLESEPDVQDAINLGALLRAQGRIREASDHYHRWLDRFPANLNLRLNGVNCLRDGGDHQTCRRWLEAGLQQAPQEPRLLQSLARTLMLLDEQTQARQLLETLVREQPTELGLWLDLGLCCHGLGDRRAALAAFEQGAAVEPEDPRPAANRITLLKELGELQQAHALVDALPPALRQAKDVRAALAGLLLNEARLEDAAVELEALCHDHPEDPLHWLNLAASLRGLKNPVACARALKRGLTLHPGHADLEQALGQSLAEMGKQEAAMELLLRSSEANQPLADSHLFNLQFLGAGYGLLSSERRLELAQQWEAHKQAEGVGPLWADVVRQPLAGRPLKVGYLSADYCNHPVGRFLLPLLRHHDRSAVEVWGLSCGPHDDGVKQALRQACDHWLEVRFGTDLEAARLIADLGLDVLVELGGFTAHSRLGLLVHRPAPVQLSYLGFYAPTYLKAIDGWIGDAALFSTLNRCDREAHQLLQLDGGYMAFVPEELPPLEPPDPSRRFRFGSFNHSRKLTSATIALWVRVLQAVPAAELVLKSISFVEPAELQRVADLFERAGLAPGRLVCLPWVEGWSNHMACYREVDVALDPLPYGGATTSCEALAMGVPLVSLAGPGMVGCLSASVLTYGADGEGVAHGLDAYVGQAASLAQPEPRTLAQRQGVRDRLHASPLSDGARLSRGLEQTYRQLITVA